MGTKRAAQKIIKEQAERCDMPYVSHRWLGGTLTNWQTVSNISKSLNLLEKEGSRIYENQTQKEKDCKLIDKELS